MSALKKIAIGTGVSVTIIGAIAAFLWPSIERINQPEIAVVGPGVELTFSIDGGKPMTVAGNGRKIVDVDEGTHTVTFIAPEAIEHSVTLASAERWIVPGLASQCYAKLDVSKSHYDTGSKGQVAPSFAEMRTESAPFKLDKYHYLHPNSLPSSVEAGHDVWLFRSSDCASIEVMAANQAAKAKGHKPAR